MNTQLFAGELEFVSVCVEKKTTIPILRNCLVSQKKRAVTLTGTDLEIAAVSAFRGDAGTINTTVPSKSLAKSLASLKGIENFQLESGAKGVTVISGDFSTTIATMSPASYPELPTLPEDGGIALPYRELAAMLTCAKHAVSAEETRFTLNGALLEVGGGVMRVVATDGHRLCVVEHPVETDGNALRFIVRTAVIPLVAKLGKGGSCTIYQHAEHEFFVASPAEGVTRLVLQRHLTGSFPDYQRVMPKEFKLKATVSREEFLRIAKQILPMTDECSRCARVTLENTLAKSGITIESSISETGSAKASVGVNFGSGPLIGKVTVGFNLQYIIEALTAMKGCDQVMFCLNAPEQAGEIDGTVDGISVREIVMPMRA